MIDCEKCMHRKNGGCGYDKNECGFVPKTGDLISREAVNEWMNELIIGLELIFSDIREKNVDDSVCGLCEYDCDHGIDGFANECPGFERDDCFKLKDSIKEEWTKIKYAQTVPVIPLSEIEGIKTEIKSWFKEPAQYIPNYEAYKRFYELINTHIKEYTEDNGENKG